VRLTAGGNLALLRSFNLGGVPYALAVSTDGRILTAGGGGLRILRWDLVSGETLLADNRPRSHHGLSLSADGDYLALAPTLDRIEVQQIGSDKRLGSFFHDGRGFALSPDGRLLAVNRRLGGVRLLDVASGERVGDPEQRLTNSSVLAFSPDGSYLAAGGLDAGVWRIRKGRQGADTRLRRRPTIGLRRSSALAFSPDGGFLVEARDTEMDFHVHEVPSGVEHPGVRLGGEADLIATGPQAWLIARADSSRIEIAERGTDHRAVIDLGQPVNRLMFTAREWVIAAGQLGDIRVWRLDRFGRRIELSNQGEILALHLSGEGDLVGVVGPADPNASGPAPSAPRLRHWRPDTLGPVQDLPLASAVTAAETSSGGGTLVLADAAGDRVRIRNAADGVIRREIDNIPDGALLATSPDGRHLAAADTAKVRVWDLETGEPILDHLVAGEPVTLVLGDEGWWLVTMRKERVQVGTRGDRQQSRYSLIDLRDPGTPALALDDLGLREPRLGPRGRYLAWRPTERSTRLCALGNRGCGPVRGLDGRLGAFSADGRFLALDDGRGATAVWDLESQLPVARLDHPSDMTPRALSNGARFLAVADARGALIVFALDPRDLLAEACTRLPRSRLTREEWDRYVGHSAPQPTCPNPD